MHASRFGFDSISPEEPAASEGKSSASALRNEECEDDKEWKVSAIAEKAGSQPAQVDK